jgi:predicted Rossmann-fold nucleotide-binding protein
MGTGFCDDSVLHGPTTSTLIQCKKIGPLPLVLMGAKFWKGMQRWGRHLMRHGVFEKKDLGFGRVTDSPQEAVELIVRACR